MRRVKRLKRKQNAHRIGFITKIVLPVILVVLVVLGFWLTTRFWNGKDKVSVVEQNQNGDVWVKVYDPTLGEITTLIIPADTEVEVSRNLGTLRMKNIWQLGVNEKLGGKLLSETVTKNFLFPVFLYIGADGENNIPIGDRVHLWYFEKSAKNLQRSEINLGESQYVRKQKLKDGEFGYRLVGNISERLTVYFLDSDFSQNPPMVYIKDSTGVYGIAETVGKVVEVLGGKVVTIEKGERQEGDCKVWGMFAQKISRVFGCSIGKDKKDFDLTIMLGEDFAKRF